MFPRSNLRLIPLKTINQKAIRRKRTKQAKSNKTTLNAAIKMDKSNKCALIKIGLEQTREKATGQK